MIGIIINRVNNATIRDGGIMRKSCFLFGHADAPQSILPDLEEAIESQVTKGVTNFFVGYHGSFDCMASTALRTIKRKHREVTATLVLSYHPAERPIEIPFGFDGTFYPPLENTPRKFAIIRANRYMVEIADCIICYVKHYGNTRNLLNYAMTHKATSIYNLAK